MSSLLCEAWQKQVQEFFTRLHGHQSKTLAWFVLGAIRAQSIVLPQVAEADARQKARRKPAVSNGVWSGF